MKFTNEDTLEKLKSILTNNGKKPLRMSERSIKSQLETLTPIVANDEMELDDFINKIKVSFETMNSNMEKDNSDFINKWENEHKPSDTKKEPEKKEPTSSDDKFEALFQKMTNLENELASAKKEKSITNKRLELEEAMEKKGIKDKEWRATFLDEIVVTEDMDVDAKADSYLKIYNKSKASNANSETPLSSESVTKNTEDLFSDIKKEFEREKEKRNL